MVCFAATVFGYWTVSVQCAVYRLHMLWIVTIVQSVSRQAYSFFQSQFLECAASASSFKFCVISFSGCHPVAAYIFFFVLIFLSILSFLQNKFRRQFLHKKCPVQLTFLCFIVCRFFISCLTCSFFTRSVQLINSILLHFRTFQIFLV